MTPITSAAKKPHLTNIQDSAELYAQDNISYWSKRSFSYSKNKQDELGTAQHALWAQTLDQRIRERFPAKSREEICVLDVGTGPGFFAIVLTELGYRVTAADYTPAMLAQAKHNAGPLAARIRFCRMDAQDLHLKDNTFDVVVTRYLTWNLPDPARAYSEWCRVLKPGGLLLNFDANWYRYLYDDHALAGHLDDRLNVADSGCFDDTAGTDIDAMESIARRAPLSAQTRPAWDLQTLAGCGMTPEADPDIWKSLWTHEEWMNNASTPMFLISAVKDNT